MATKKSFMGRQRVEMAKIKNKSLLQVTFSKRCAGLFKKASEQCTLCGVDIAIIVFSPAGKAFSFGLPSVETIINKFLTKLGMKCSSPRLTVTSAEPQQTSGAIISELHQQMEWLSEQQEVEKKKGDMLGEVRKAGQSQFWWEAPFEKLGLDELQQLLGALQELQRNVVSAQGESYASNPWPFTVNTCGEITSEGNSSAEASGEGFVSSASYQISSHDYDYDFC